MLINFQSFKVKLRVIRYCQVMNFPPEERVRVKPCGQYSWTDVEDNDDEDEDDDNEKVLLVVG